MKILKTIDEIRKYSFYKKNEKLNIGFVPTMGFLHHGHISLIKKSVSLSDITIVSIFVNPTQFTPNEDFNTYPRDTEKDISLCKKAGVDAVFIPETEYLYPLGFSSFVSVGDIANTFEGAFRSGHFNGVATIVLKLLNIVCPDTMFVGQKDAQQAFVLKKMIKDLNLCLKLFVCDTIRDKNGLALSSRNIYLDKTQYDLALNISKALFQMKKLLSDDITDNIIDNSSSNIQKNATDNIIDNSSSNIQKNAKDNGNDNIQENTRDNIFLKNKIIGKLCESFFQNPRIKLDYFDVVDIETFKPVDTIKKNNNAIIAAKIDNKIRLIDNVIL